MWLGVLEAAVWLFLSSFMVVSFFKFIGLRQSRPDGSGKKSLGAGAKRNAQVGKLGETSGGTDFLLARPG
jgi:hypothetical protein